MGFEFQPCCCCSENKQYSWNNWITLPAALISHLIYTCAWYSEKIFRVTNECCKHKWILFLCRFFWQLLKTFGERTKESTTWTEDRSQFLQKHRIVLGLVFIPLLGLVDRSEFVLGCLSQLAIVVFIFLCKNMFLPHVACLFAMFLPHAACPCDWTLYSCDAS